MTKIMHFVRNCEYCRLYKTVWCEGGLKLTDIGTNNISLYGLNTKLTYAMIRLDYLHNTCQVEVT